MIDNLKLDEIVVSLLDLLDQFCNLIFVDLLMRVFLHLLIDLLQILPLLDVVLVRCEYCVYLIYGVLGKFDLMGEGLQVFLHLLLGNHHAVVLHFTLEERLLLVELCLTGHWLILNSLVWLWLAFLSLGFGMSF